MTPSVCDALQRLREAIDYDPLTGIAVYRKNGKRVGSINSRGYRTVRFEGVTQRFHRLMWLYVHGEWPKHTIDHINGIKTDNRLANLRDVERRLNQQNISGPQANNRSGFRGVSMLPSKRWRAQINLRTIGIFATPEEASAAYIEAKRRLHPGSTI
jgi:hypothetical protein